MEVQVQVQVQVQLTKVVVLYMMRVVQQRMLMMVVEALLGPVNIQYEWKERI
jgi:hypothetical protein